MTYTFIAQVNRICMYDCMAFPMVSHFIIIITLITAAGVDNPAFIPEMDTSPPMRNPPWQTESANNTAVVPSQRAQGRLPWTPTDLRHLAPLGMSTHSTESFTMTDASVDEEAPEEKPGTHTRL